MREQRQILEQQLGTAAEKLERIGGLIYNYGEECFGKTEGRKWKEITSTSKVQKTARDREASQRKDTKKAVEKSL